MRIVSCHIENFGKLHDYTIDFSKGINLICEENGWGKSTFAAFIRAMFYGLEGERKRSVDENERKKYLPWQGGVFGGQLIFESDGKEYQISRIFRDKEANDEFELREVKTNLISKDYSKKIGEELFRINRESFMRTIFIGQNECETASTDDINAKIGDLSENTNDLNSFDAAYTRLTEILNGLNPSRATGSVSKRRDEIARIDKLVQDGKGIAESVESYQRYLKAQEETYDVLKIKMNEAGELQAKVSKLQSAISQKSQWERLRDIETARKNKLDLCKSKFKGEIPELAEVKAKIDECADLEKANERVSLYCVSEAEMTEFNSLRSMFEQGVPSDAEITEKLEEAGTFRILSQQHSANQMSSAEKQRWKELEAHYAEDEGVAPVIGKWNTRNMKKAALPSNQAAVTALKVSENTRTGKKIKLTLPLIVLGIVMALGGIATVILKSIIIGCSMVVAGIILSVIGIVINGKSSAMAETEASPELENLMQTIEADLDYIKKVDEEVAAYLASHEKVFDEDMVSVMLQEISAEAVEYSTLKKKAQLASETITTSELYALRQKIMVFLEEFDIYSSEMRFSDDLYALKDAVSRYRLLSDKHKNFKESVKQYNEVRDRMDCFLKGYEYVPEENVYVQLNRIREDVDDYLDAVKSWQEADRELKDFEEGTDVSLLQDALDMEDIPSLEEINQTILQITDDMEKVHGSILSYNKTLEGLQEKYDEWEENRIKLEELCRLQEEEQKKYDYVLKARVKLSLAKESMTAKYADPILERFCEYFEMITENADKQFHMDANTTITIAEQGKQRETNTLSAGYRDLVGICMRIALVDVMYQGEMPAVIMDDPFTNLDDKKLDAAKSFLEKIAEKYQIIYLTCSNARSL